MNLLNDIYEKKLTPKAKKGKITAGILVVPPFITETVIEDSDGKPKKIYGGFVYDMWSIIKKVNNWDEYILEVPVKVNYDKAVNEVTNGKYDICVGNFWVLKDRINKVLISQPLFISKVVTVFKPKKSRINTIIGLGITYFILPLTIIIICGLIFGYGLYKLEPRRGFVRSTRTATATFFGEAGYLFENSTLNLKALLYIYIVMTIAYFFNVVLQGIVTTDIINETSKNEINIQNIGRSTPLIVSSFYDIGEVMEKHGARYTILDKQIQDIPKIYLSNTDKYSGYLTEYEEAKMDILRYSELRITNDIFGFKENVFIISNSRPDIKKEIDMSIVKLHHNNSFGDICKKYMSEDDAIYCTM